MANKGLNKGKIQEMSDSTNRLYENLSSSSRRLSDEQIKNWPLPFSKEELASQTWRMNNLYSIKTEEGKKIPFRFNWAQKDLYNRLHYCNIILKARQLGLTTFCCIFLLDQILWNDNTQAAILAHTFDDASNIFQDKLRFAFDQLDPRVRALFKPIGDSAKELSFSNGSSIRVGTSLRSSTLQYLHISEFGKICAKYPERAKEVVTGSLNTIHAGQTIFIESTAEGKQGYFHDMVQEARKKTSNLSKMEFKFFFFPWWKEPKYSIGVVTDIPDNLREYFDKLALDGIKLRDSQKWWYSLKWKTQKDDMNREFPSTPDEAFSASQDGYWYASYIKELYDSGHVTNVSYDRAIPVHTAWDLGQSDEMAIWFFQINRSGDINVIDFWQKSDTPLNQLVILLKEKGYTYDRHIWPHDAHARGRGGITFAQQARPFGLIGTGLEQHGLMQGINLVKSTLPKCWFDRTKCAEGLRLLENYKKKWNSSFGGWTSEPVHDASSHAADAFRYLSVAIDRIGGGSGSLEQDYSILRKYWGG